LEGDDDPFEATYAIWNGSRTLHAIGTGNVAISKRSGGMWALEHLPERWHEAIRAAGRAYDAEATPRDAEVLRETMYSTLEDLGSDDRTAHEGSSARRHQRTVRAPN
jgi:hypothetical protein